MSEQEVDLRQNSKRFWEKTVCERAPNLLKAIQSLCKETKIYIKFTDGNVIRTVHYKPASPHTIQSIYKQGSTGLENNYQVHNPAITEQI